jgi:hypothetical protein
VYLDAPLDGRGKDNPLVGHYVDEAPVHWQFNAIGHPHHEIEDAAGS